MKTKLRQTFSLAVLLLVLVGCSTAIAKETTPTPPATPLSDRQAAEPTPELAGAQEALVAQAVSDLKARLGSSAQVILQEVVPVDFSDTSLGVPEPGGSYAQVLTPGYVIRLAVEDREYKYHAAGERVVLASGDAGAAGEVTIKSVHITVDALTVDGQSTFPDGTSIQTELLAGGQGVLWWPESAYAVVRQGDWQIMVSLGGAILDRELEHVVYAWAEQHDSSQVAFPFDLAGPRNTPVLPTPDEGEYSRVEIADAGLSLEIPTDWLHLEPEWLWAPRYGSDLCLGVQWADLEPPQEVESLLLPKPSQVLGSDEVALSWGNGRRFMLEVYAPAAQGEDEKAPVASVEMHTLVVINQEGQRRAFDLYAKASNAGNLDALEPVLAHALNTSALIGPGSQSPPTQDREPSEQRPPQGGTLFQDEGYGYQIVVPSDWSWTELPAQGPGTPDDWPLVRIVHLYPQAWEAELHRSGPPDPTAKPVVAPLQIEVVVGPPHQFRRVYPEPTESEAMEVNGLPVTIEKEAFNGMSLRRYVFTSPENPELYVTVSDQMTGFPDRVSGNEAIAEHVSEIVQSFKFSDDSQ